MDVKYFYEFTGNSGKNLFDSLNESDFQKLIDGQSENYKEEGGPGGEWRDCFINEYLWDKLNGTELDQIAEGVPELQGKPNEAIKEWLKENKCPDRDEEEAIQQWAWESAGYDAQDSCLWDHFDHDNDVEAALNFGFIGYASNTNSEFQSLIPDDVAKRINELVDQRNAEQDSNKSNAISKQVYFLENSAAEKLTKVTGFYCDIHGGKSEYDEPLP